jgi:hypothetical protein
MNATQMLPFMLIGLFFIMAMGIYIAIKEEP